MPDPIWSLTTSCWSIKPADRPLSHQVAQMLGTISAASAAGAGSDVAPGDAGIGGTETIGGPPVRMGPSVDILASFQYPAPDTSVVPQKSITSKDEVAPWFAKQEANSTAEVIPLPVFQKDPEG